jgi:hypothetical protein
MSAASQTVLRINLLHKCTLPYFMVGDRPSLGMIPVPHPVADSYIERQSPARLPQAVAVRQP